MLAAIPSAVAGPLKVPYAAQGQASSGSRNRQGLKSSNMGVKTMRSVDEVLDGSLEYAPSKVSAPRLSGIGLKLFVWAVESLIGSAVVSKLKRSNGLSQLLSETVITEEPMFFPEYEAQKITELEVLQLDETSHPSSRVETALTCLPSPHLSLKQKVTGKFPFLYWTIRDYVKAYKSGHTTPTEVAQRFIAAIDDSQSRSPPMPFFISFIPEDILTQAAASTERYASGKPLSGIDGVLFAVKDDIDCAPHASTGGTVWLHKYREVKQDAVCVERLRKCGVVMVGKTNMHELGMGTTGFNPHYGTVRNPHDTERYTGGSSSGSTALVATGLVPGALGTDVGGSVRVPASLCGTVGLKLTVGRTTLEGVAKVGWTMESVGPIAANVEDALLLYAAMAGSLPNDVLFSRPLPPCVPLLGDETQFVLCQLKLGKYSAQFNHVSSPEVSKVCEKTLQLLHLKFGTEIREVLLPEQEELRNGHLATVASEVTATFDPYFSTVLKQCGYETRATLALFQSFTSGEYISAQRLRRRFMHYYMQAFETVDVIVTPTTAMTAPLIQKDTLKVGESDLAASGNLMRFIVPGNFLGLPCLSVPVGHDSKGLPIGLQLIGRPWEEATLLRVASAIEELCATSRTRPKIFYDLM